MMRVLNGSYGVSQRRIGNEINTGLSGMNYVLKALVDRRVVKLGNSTKSYREMKCEYFVTPEGMTKKTKIMTRFWEKKMTEYVSL